MSVFGGLILTNRGRNLQIKAQTGVQLNYTKVSIGDGALGSSSVLDLAALKNKVMDLQISKLKVLASGKAVIGTVLSNQNIPTGFYFREIGIFATDPDLGEILYCYGNAGVNAEYIPAGGGPDIIEKSIDINVVVGNATNVTATIDSSLIYVTKPEYDTDINQINHILEEHDTKLDDLIFETAGGTGTAITLTLPTTMVNGYAKTFIANVNNGGAATAINGKPLYKPGTIISPSLTKDKAYTVWYNLTGDCFFIKASAEGNVLASQVLKDKTFSNDSDTGLKGTLDLSLLVSANVKAGVTINGVAGKASVIDTSDATVAASQMITGTTAYKNGSKVTGAMPYITGDASAHYPATQLSAGAYSGDGKNYAYMGVPNGNFLNNVAWIKSAQPDLLASNIVSGKNIFGVAGSVTVESLGGRRYNQNTINSYASGTNIKVGFRPTSVIAFIYYNGTWNLLKVTSPIIDISVSIYASGTTSGSGSFQASGITITSTGFSISSSANTLVYLCVG